MDVADFDFDLPPDRIAQEPAPRGASRLLVVDRAARTWHEAAMADLPSILAPGDLLIGNDTRVFPARLLGRRHPTGGAAECLLVSRVGPDEWDALVHPGQKLKPGSEIVFEDAERTPGVRLVAQVLDQRFFGRRRVRLTVTGASNVDEAVDALGHVPLPPYIHRADRPDDRARYQTVYAASRGSIAAPTAGLHFDDHTLAAIAGAGIGWATVTLHVGYGTFKPVRVETVEDHEVDPERYDVPSTTADAIARTHAAGHRVVAIGTTTTRALESAAKADGTIETGPGEAKLFIYPGHRFRAIDALVTNFHLPKSSLLMLVSAFAGRELILDAYKAAIAKGFRFYSYGDAMVIV